MDRDLTTIAVSEFKATCLEVLRRVGRTGESMLVTRRGKPVAMIVPPPPPEPEGSWLGSFRGSARIEGDVISPAVEEKEWEVLEK